MEVDGQRAPQYPHIMAALAQQESPRTSIRRPRLMFAFRQPNQPPTTPTTSTRDRAVSFSMTESKQRQPSPMLGVFKTAMGHQRSPSSPVSTSSSGKKSSCHTRTISSPTHVEIIRSWNEDVPAWTSNLSHDVPPSPKAEFESLTPLPAHISRAAAKRLGIAWHDSNAPGGAPLETFDPWPLHRHKRDDSIDTDITPPLVESNTFYSSDSSDGESVSKDRSSYSSDSSRTSYNVPTPPDATASPISESIKMLDAIPSPVTMMQPLIAPNTPPVQALPVFDSKPTMRVVETSHPALDAIPLAKAVLKPLQEVEEVEDAVEDEITVRNAVDLIRQPSNDDFQDVLNGIADTIRDRLMEATSTRTDKPSAPTVPERSRKRLMKSLTVHTTSSPVTSLAITPRLSHPAERQRSITVHPSSRYSSDAMAPTPPPRSSSRLHRREQSQDDGEFISANAAELVILNIYYKFTDVQDLFAAARINRGFYSVFKRNELRLIKLTIRNYSPAAWELREATKFVQNGRANFRASALHEYTATRYLQAYKRDTYILGALKSLILSRCQTRLSVAMESALRDRDCTSSSRADDALWRIWTFCTIFGNGNNREDDIIDQVDWLRGGAYAHFSNSAEFQVVSQRTSTNPLSFGRGNIGGLTDDQLRDMLEMWGCVKSLLQGIVVGTGRAEQARKHGVFESVRMDTGGSGAAERLLEEWYHYLCTLGLSAAFDLAAPSTSRTARVFNTARDMGWTKWSPSTNGSSRAGFLRIAIERALEERARISPCAQPLPASIPVAPSADTTTTVSASLTSVPEVLAESAETVAEPTNHMITAAPMANSKPLEADSMSQWIKYIAGLEAAPPAILPAAHIAAQHNILPSTSATAMSRSATDPVPASATMLVDLDVALPRSPRTPRPQAMHFTDSMLRFPWQDVQMTTLTPAAAVGAGLLTMPVPAPQKDISPLPLSRFNSVNGHGRGIDMDRASRPWSLRTKASAPELCAY